ncbi:hypothetical protein AB5J62_08535 [Amycolatopsis sp. cg5]|uniref:hypothetical protein n=1 Tax=Amycolatopsis sp. cg5 TaxID=3238802 RepID=UPI0035235B29
MLRLGIFLAIIGFGSMVLPQFDLQFTLLMWADPYQPTIGIVVGVIGLALVGVGVAAKNKKKAVAPQQP